MEEAVKEPITDDGQKLLVEVTDGEMKMTISSTPYELFTIVNSIESHRWSVRPRR